MSTPHDTPAPVTGYLSRAGHGMDAPRKNRE